MLRKYCKVMRKFKTIFCRYKQENGGCMSNIQGIPGITTGDEYSRRGLTQYPVSPPTWGGRNTHAVQCEHCPRVRYPARR